MIKPLLALILIATLTITGSAFAHQVTVAQANSDQALGLGDGKYSTSGPRKGYIYSCTKVGGGGGAFQDGPWIKSNSTWVPSEKIAVQGNVSWPQANFSAQLGSKLTLSGNGLPTNHTTGIFPIATSDPAYNYDRNPNSISAQTVKFSLTASPKKAKKPSCLPMGAIGIMLNGVQVFNGLDGQGKDAPAHEIQDSCQGHPERSGAYHYHSLSSCLSDSSSGHSKLLGYALDGFGIYGPRSLGGKQASNASLDICHGHSHKLTVTGKSKAVYHYHVTANYPYTLGCFRGTPIKTQTSGQNGNNNPPGNLPPPPGGLPPMPPPGG